LCGESDGDVGDEWRRRREDDIRGLAVSAFGTQANDLVRHKVGAALVDQGVDGQDLIPGDWEWEWVSE